MLANSTLNATDQLNIYSSDTLLVRRRSSLTLSGDLDNRGVICPDNPLADSIWIYLTGRGRRVLKGNDPYQFMSRQAGAERVYNGMFLMDVTGKVPWPWASKIREVVLGRGILALKAGDSLGVNRLVRINGQLHGHIKPLRWAGSPFTLHYAKGTKFGVWSKDIAWGNTPDFAIYQADAQAQVLLDTYDPTREVDGSSYLMLDTSIVARNITFKSALMTRPQDTITVARNQQGWVHNGVLRLSPSLPAIPGLPAGTTGTVAYGRSEIPLKLVVNSMSPADATLQLQGVQVYSDGSGGKPVDGVGMRIISDSNLVISDYTLQRMFWQDPYLDTHPYNVRTGCYGLYQSHSPTGPWKPLALHKGEPITTYNTENRPQVYFWARELRSNLSGYFQFKPILLKNGAYLAYFTGSSSKDLRARSLHLTRKTNLDGHPQAPGRAIGVEVVNNGTTPANGYRVGCRINGGPVVYSAVVNNPIALPVQSNSTNSALLWRSVDTVWIAASAQTRFTSPQLHQITAWVEYEGDSVSSNDTVHYTLDLRPLPLNRTLRLGQFDSSNTANTSSYDYPSLNYTSLGRFWLNNAVVAESKALDSIPGQAQYSNWLDPRFMFRIVSSGFGPIPVNFGMGYNGSTCIQPWDGERRLTTRPFGPVGANAKVGYRYGHGGLGFQAANSVIPAPMRAEDTIYVETNRNNGPWIVLHKIHAGNVHQGTTMAGRQETIPAQDGELVRVRFRYASVYQPLLATPYPASALLLDSITVVSDPVAVAPQVASGLPLQVYPNPGSGRYTIANLPEGTSTVRVVDVQGREVLRTTIDGVAGDQSVDIASAPTGLYILQVQGRNGTNVCKLIKQ